jgi:polygalacturonase
MTTLIPKINFKNGLATPTGAISRTINEKAQDTVSVKDFGALGDGTTNDATAFTNAWTASNPRAVLVPAGSYKITGTVTGKFYSFGVVTIVTGTVTSITNLVP